MSVRSGVVNLGGSVAEAADTARAFARVGALEEAGFTLPEPIYGVRLYRRGALPNDETALPLERAEILVPPSAEAAAASAPKDRTFERKAAADRRLAAATDLLGRGGAPE